jgi:iron complex outermembrane receptor protein
VKTRHLLFGVSTLALLGVAAPALAQADDTFTAEEIVVTARKRVESLQDVPAAITAISGETLKQTGSAGIEDFVRMAPGLNLANTGFGGFQNFRIRGVATDSGTSVLQGPVSLYLDETPTIDPYVPYGTADFYLADIDRVEVLRGPQGTLFGSGSLSGAVRVLTKKPKLGVVEGYVEAGVSTVSDGGTGYSVEGAVNVPLGDKFALRAVAYDRQIPGYIDNIALNRTDSNEGEMVGGRIALRGELTEALTVTASLVHQETTFDDGSKSFVDGGPGGTRQWNALTADSRKDRSTIGTLVAELDLGWASLTSATSYLDMFSNPHVAFDAFSPVLGFPGTSTQLNGRSNSGGWIEELRLASKGDGPFSYLVGLYYSDRKTSIRSLLHNAEVEQFFGLDNIFTSALDAKVREAALFGELSYEITPKLELAVGVRVFRNKFQSAQVSDGLVNGFVVSSFERNKTEEDYTPRVTLTWKPTDDLTIYGQAAKGYRIGQSNATVGDVPPTFDPDYLWNYEVGLKSDFWEHRARVAIAAFYIDWQNLQVQLPGPFGPYTGNAGSARSIGLEFEGSVFLTHDLELMTSFALTNAELTESVPTLIQPSGVVGVSDGDALPGSAKFTMTNAIRYTHDLGEGRAFYARLDHQYVGGSYNSFTSQGAYRMGDYRLFNASIGFDFPMGVGLSAYVKNIGDEDGATNVLFDSLGGIPQAIRVPPRTFGVALSKTF